MKHVLFDLDGTLLPMNQDEFVKCYLTLLAKHFAVRGSSPDRLTDAVWKSVGAMYINDGTQTNEEAFWSCFEQFFPVKREEIEPDFLDFYLGDFNQAIASTQPSPHAAESIRLLKDTGVQFSLATNPIFPRCATLSRIRWAGLYADDFAEITTYENYHYSKPNILYFKEIMDKLGLNPKDCLMVGNDAEEDLCIRELGVKTFLVTDCLENKKGLPLTSEYAGSLEELRHFIPNIPNL